MPANLPPHYYEAEQRFREATNNDDKISILEEMMQIMPKHKGTDKLRAELRKKISKLKTQPAGGKGPAKHASPINITREGAGQLVLTGVPNTGKSSILNAVSNAEPEIGEYGYTTRMPCAGMMNWGNIQLQLVDTPPLNNDYMEPWLPDLIKRADIVGLVIDASLDPLTDYENALRILESVKVQLVKPEESQRFPIEGGIFLKKTILIITKIDETDSEANVEAFHELIKVELPIVHFSTKLSATHDDLGKMIYQLLDLIRVYAKPIGEKPDLNEPFVLPKNSTVEDFTCKIHKDVVEKFQYAKIWGEHTHDGQTVNKDFLLHEGDILEVHY